MAKIIGFSDDRYKEIDGDKFTNMLKDMIKECKEERLSCKHKNLTYIGVQQFPKSLHLGNGVGAKVSVTNKVLYLYNCDKCGTTVTGDKPKENKL